MSRGMAVVAFTVVVLAASVLLVSRLRTLDADRAAGRRTIATMLGATGTRVLYSILVVSAYGILPIAWALDLLPTFGLLPFLTSPLAIRLGDTVSHRSGAALDGALREAVLLFLAFEGLLVVLLG
jgi:1,4-dihydroxy-2-naphthoate octaprenyltransferase